MNAARNAARNGKIKESQKTYNTADKKQGSYYILNETPEQKNRRYEEEHGVKNNQAGDKASDKAGDKGTTPASKEEAAKTESKAGKDAKAGQKAAGKALPKTSAVK